MASRSHPVGRGFVVLRARESIGVDMQAEPLHRCLHNMLAVTASSSAGEQGAAPGNPVRGASAGPCFTNSIRGIPCQTATSAKPNEECAFSPLWAHAARGTVHHCLRRCRRHMMTVSYSEVCESSQTERETGDKRTHGTPCGTKDF